MNVCLMIAALCWGAIARLLYVEFGRTINKVNVDIYDIKKGSIPILVYAVVVDILSTICFLQFILTIGQYK